MRKTTTGMSSPVVVALLIASGAAALVYQALWVKQVGLVVGVDVYAVTAVVSAFFGGLALGGAVLGARADVSPRPLALYAWLELGVAVTGLATTLVLSRLATPYVAIEDAVGRAAWLLPFALVAIPATFMGGTLPALLRAVRPRAGAIGTASGMLYAANTAGGVLGVLAAPFLLVPALGVRGAGIAAAAANLALALAAAALARRSAPSPPGAAARAAATKAAASRSAPPAASPVDATSRDAGTRLALPLYAVAGGIALGFEVVWSQAVVQFINTRAFAFALVLATYLTGLVVGSAVWARFADRVRDPWRAFGLLEAGAGVAALGCFGGLGIWLPTFQKRAGAAVLASVGPLLSGIVEIALAPIALLLLPTLLLGAAFPVVARLACGPDQIGRDIGAVAALNTLGGILGTLVTGFILVPALGLSRTLALLATGAVVVGGVAVLRGVAGAAPAVRRRIAAAVALGVVAVAGGGLLVAPDHLARLLVAQRRGGSLDFYEESPGGTVAVVREPLMRVHFHRLYINGVSNSADHLLSRRYMRLQTLLPLLLHQGESRSVLVVGLGTGITCGTTLAWPGLERRVCAELLPAVVHAVDRFDGNLGVATDPRVTIRIADGRHLLLRDPTTWDVITLEPPPPIAAGVVNLYSRDFYDLCRDRLAPGGIMAQWFPLTTQDVDTSRTLVRSFIDAFPYATMWTTETHEMLLVGGREPLVIDVPEITARMAQPEVRQVLAEVGIADTAALLATYVTDRAGLEAFVGNAPAVTDDRPNLEHGGLFRPVDFLRIFQETYALRRDPPLVGGSDALRTEIATRRERLYLFYNVMLLADLGQGQRLKPLREQVLGAEGANPYYRFIEEFGW